MSSLAEIQAQIEALKVEIARKEAKTQVALVACATNPGEFVESGEYFIKVRIERAGTDTDRDISLERVYVQRYHGGESDINEASYLYTGALYKAVPTEATPTTARVRFSEATKDLFKVGDAVQVVDVNGETGTAIIRDVGRTGQAANVEIELCSSHLNLYVEPDGSRTQKVSVGSTWWVWTSTEVYK